MGFTTLLTLALTVIIPYNNLSLAVQNLPTVENQIPNLNSLEALVKECFATRNENSDITYDGDNIIEVLNSKAGAQLFIPSKNGLKINSKIFSSLLGSCLKSKIQILSNNDQIQNDFIKDTLNDKEREVSMIADYFLDDQEISFNDLESLIKSRSTWRAKRDLEFRLNIIQEILINFIIAPVKSGVNSVFNNVIAVFEYLILDTDTITDPIQSTFAQLINSLVKLCIYLVSDIQVNIISIVDSFNATNTSSNSTSTSNSTEKMSRDLEVSIKRDIISDLINSIIVTPIKTTVNNILVTLNSTIYSFYNTNSTDPVQSVLNGFINVGVLNVVSIITTIYTAINSLLDNFTV